MLGRSYHSGEGTRRSLPKARGAYAKTCRLAPDFESCDFARENLQQHALGEPVGEGKPESLNGSAGATRSVEPGGWYVDTAGHGSIGRQ
jgi:hypothetical protein